MATTSRRVFFSVGEPSGDLHGANLIRELRRQDPDIDVVGFGGPRMQQAGMTLMADLTQLAVMWIVQALKNLDHFWKLLWQADAYFKTERPDAVVLIDYPGFNWWIARRAKKHGIPVFYYGAPQMWAWGGWRIGKIRRLVDHVLCKLPFEAEWYQQRGCRATFVGHPYFDELNNQQLDREFIQRRGSPHWRRLVAILPGSRTQEVKNNLPWFLKAAERIHQQSPETRFAIASFNEDQAALAREMVDSCSLPIEIFTNRTGELIKMSHCCMACSGSVSLELMYHTRPSVILYWLPRFTYFLGKQLLQVRYMTLVNLLACEDRYLKPHAPVASTPLEADPVPMPEFPTYQDKSPELAAHVLTWLNDLVAHQRRVDQLVDLKKRFCTTGATETAARYILDQLQTPHQSQHSRSTQKEAA